MQPQLTNYKGNNGSDEDCNDGEGRGNDRHIMMLWVWTRLYLLLSLPASLPAGGALLS